MNFKLLAPLPLNALLENVPVCVYSETLVEDIRERKKRNPKSPNPKPEREMGKREKDKTRKRKRQRLFLHPQKEMPLSLSVPSHFLNMPVYYCVLLGVAGAWWFITSLGWC